MLQPIDLEIQAAHRSPNFFDTPSARQRLCLYDLSEPDPFSSTAFKGNVSGLKSGHPVPGDR